ncbi:hypothetical protein BH11ARM2_BH11ARM2_32470 [soil metagenome]
MRNALKNLFGTEYVAKVELRGADALGPEGAEFARRTMRRLGGQIEGNAVKIEGRDPAALRSRVETMRVELSAALFDAGYDARLVA